jgi:hypothetical protein
MLVVTDDVLQEQTGTTPQTAPDANARLALVTNVMRDPEYAGRKLARLVAANIPATMGLGGPDTPLTDDELVAYIASRWNALGQSLYTNK